MYPYVFYWVNGTIYAIPHIVALNLSKLGRAVRMATLREVLVNLDRVVF